MLKIGIITMYYDSVNYGGLLQSYALCRYINNHTGCHAEQICYKSDANAFIPQDSLRRFLNASFFEKVKKITRKLKKTINSNLTNLLIKKYIKEKNESVKVFRNKIPHSINVYTAGSIHRCNDYYDVFITGSDRVWNPLSIGSPYYLSFVKEKKKKGSYAASLAGSFLDENQKKKLRTALSGFSMVSVREQETCSIIKDISPVDVQWVVDPVLLLEREEWEELELPCNLPDNYMFCYYLGTDAKNRRIAKKYAKEKGYLLVTIPYANNVYVLGESSYADKLVSNASPEMFLTLIKNAECIFTDSFHATVFATIFHKEVFSFSRKDMRGSGSRLESLTRSLGTSNRYCDSNKKKRLGYINAQKRINYNRVDLKIQAMIRDSKEILDTFLDLN